MQKILFGPVFASCFAAPVGVVLHFRNRLGKGTLANQLKRGIPLCVLQKAPVLSVNLIDLWGLHSKHPASLSELAFLCHVARRALNCSISMSSTLTLLALWLHQPQLAGPPPQILGKSTLNCQQLTSKNCDEHDLWYTSFNPTCMAGDCDWNIVVYSWGFFSLCNVFHSLCLVIFFDICVKIIFWAAKLYHKMNKRNFHCHHYCLLLYFLYAMTSFYSKLWWVFNKLSCLWWTAQS